jgi:hypothetical protein
VIAINDVRVAIGDIPKRFPRTGATPVVIGKGNGTDVSFFLPTTGIQPVLAFQVYGSLVLYEKTSSTDYTQINSSLYTFTAPDQIVFGTAPTDGTEIAARYLTSAFLDSDIQAELGRATLQFPGNDDLILKKCMYDYTGQQLMNPGIMMYLHEGDFNADPSILSKSLADLRKQLANDLTGKVRANMNLPSVVITGQDYHPYTPER